MNKPLRRTTYSIGVLTCALFCALCSSKITKVSAEDSLNKSDGTNLQTLGGGDLLESALGTLLESEEKAFLNAQEENKLTYTESFNKGNVKTARIGNDLIVFANASSYTDNHGDTWTWQPTTVEADQSYGLTEFGDYAYAKFSDPSHVIQDVRVNYKLNLDVSKDKLNSFRNEAYTFSVEQNEYYNDYLKACEVFAKRPKSQDEYDAKQTEYEQYLEDYAAYLNEKENYDNYLSDYALYENQLAAYNQYLLDKSNYEQQVQAYAQYLEDLAYYNENKDQNQRDYEEYGYLYDCSRYQMNAMKIPWIVDKNRSSSLYTYIWSDKASLTLEHKSELLALGIPTGVIDNGNSSTVALRTLFDNYKSLSSDEERYSYYFVNYEKLSYNAGKLLRTLEYMWRDPKIVNLIIEKGKLQQYVAFLSMVIYFTNAINDQVVVNYEGFNEVSGLPDLTRPGAYKLDETYKVYEGKTYLQILSGYDFLDTTNKATPAKGSWPTKQVELLTAPEEATKPVEPTVVKEPTKPEEVTSPVAPTVVEKPYEYDPNATEPVLSETLQNEINFNLLTAYRLGRISEHDEFTEDYVLTLRGELDIDVDENLTNVAIFKDALGNDYCYNFFTSGTTFDEKEPFKDGDNLHDSYLFKYWSLTSDDGGEPLDLSLLSESCYVYPIYKGGPSTIHEITWVYPDEQIKTSHYAETIPEEPKVPSKEETSDHYYEFAGWSPEIHAVDAPETYVATFNEYNLYDITIVIDDQVKVIKGKENKVLNLPTSYDLVSGTHYNILGWEEEVTLVTGEKTYHAIFEKYYTITWNVLGNIGTQLFPAGAEIVYSGAIPANEYYDDCYYVFKWNTSLGIADDNKVIVGTMAKKYYPTITFDIDHYLIDQTGNYIPGVEGMEIEFPTSYSMNFADYEITGYEETSPNYFTFTFVKHPYVAEDILLSKDNNTYIVNGVNANVDAIDIHILLEKMADGTIENLPMTIINKGVTIALSSAQVNTLINKHAQSVYVTSSSSAGVTSYMLRAKTTSGTFIDVNSFTPLVTINGSFDEKHADVYVGEDKVTSSISSSSLSLRAKLNTSYDVISTYNISIQSTANVNVTLSKTNARMNEKVHFEYTPNYGYKIVNVLVTKTNGQVINVDDHGDFIMPAGDVKIIINSIKEVYTVNLIVDGQDFATYRVSYGTSLDLPMFIIKAPDESNEYQFVGWGVEGSSITVTEDVTLNAKFTAKPIEKVDTNKVSNIMTAGNIVLICLIVVGLGLGLFFIIRYSRKHSSKRQK